MSWNYRVVHKKGTSVLTGPWETWGIHEAYYNQPGDETPRGVTEEPVDVFGHDLDDLRWTLQEMTKALDKPVLEYGDIVKEKP
jgi:hypothetical protein